jgi:deoxycytidylate deaminase
MINHIFDLRKKLLIIGLTGRTGSGCTTVANMLHHENVNSLKSNYSEFRDGTIDNNVRKDRIVYLFIRENWQPFLIITASDLIYYFALQLPFEEFLKYVIQGASSKSVAYTVDKSVDQADAVPHQWKQLEAIKGEYEEVANKVAEVESGFQNKNKTSEFCQIALSLLFEDLHPFREKLESAIDAISPGIVPKLLQQWGNNVRLSGSIHSTKKGEKSPSYIAEKIDQFIQIVKYNNDENGNASTRIVIDALRNPFEILFFRELYASFYCMSVNTTKEIRHEKLLKEKKMNWNDIEELDNNEKEKGDFVKSFQMIDIDKCIELSDIHLSHDGVEAENNTSLVNQILTYLSLMLHPGLVPPTPQERIMQIAYTAKLNSGCLSRQVGAAVTDSNFSVKSIGWNSVPEGQVPCNLRRLDDLFKKEDSSAFSYYELSNEKFKKHVEKLREAYNDQKRLKLKGLGLTYCFKNIYTNITDRQKFNQVHTRSLHAEENAFLQLAKYGCQGVQGGNLFTTASCCELCAKKAYHLGIRKIYYIDSYPGISREHIFESGDKQHRPEIILFSGAVGRAYINLYNQFLPIKDEIEVITEVKVSDPTPQEKKEKDQNNDGNNNTDGKTA